MADRKKRLVFGIFAHVDAGKTTLSEAMLYRAGFIRKFGRVDHGDAFLDTDVQERERGITIFSSTAHFSWRDCAFTMLDTPGHTDFSGETERALTVLDCAVLVINASDGVQSHTRTLWHLLERYRVPTFLFVNKMDQPGTDRDAILAKLRLDLSEGCADYAAESFSEQAAGESEEAMESYLADGTVPMEEIRSLIGKRAIFPCLFGAALRSDGVEELLDTLADFASVRDADGEPGAVVYKISRDAQGGRLTWLRVTSGTLRVREPVSGIDRNGDPWQEKLHQLRLYSGEKYVPVDEAPSGTLCAVTGLTATWPGDAIGCAERPISPMLESVFTYRVLPGENDPHTVLQKLRILEEEEPQLHVTYNETLRELRVQLMGEIQLEILQRQFRERFGMDILFDEGSVLYRETIARMVEGVGHYEPLRHYAEVHLLLEPRERGSGMVFSSRCPTDSLDLNWQRLILTHLREKEHLGVLTGAPLTDMRITLMSGRAHEKHTEGGDFRQATYRAVRQGLMSTQNILLEPWYDIRLEVPAASVGRAMADVQRMGGELEPGEVRGDYTVLTGRAPVAEIRSYAREVTVYTRGTGRFSSTFGGYEPCRRQSELVAQSEYDPERDLENSPDSIFCSHGAGYPVKWSQVPQHMHLESCLRPARREESAPEKSVPSVPAAPRSTAALDKELQAIYERTYGKQKERSVQPRSPITERRTPSVKASPIPTGPEYVLADGYNLVHAWEELSAVAEDNMDAARQLLMDILSNYQGVTGCRLILVFDAYRVPEHCEEIIRYHNIHVVYTREAETADAYIEKTAHEIARQHRVRVATSDALEQLIILGQGALRVSASAFHEEVASALAQMRRTLNEVNSYSPRRDLAAAMERAEQERD